jgi:hypothetical protein
MAEPSAVGAILAQTRMLDTLKERFLENPENHARIRPGQRKLIFATAGRLGLRDEQLHDLVEGVSDQRTRAIARLTIQEARRLIGLLKTMERNSARLVAGA